jgi:His/Glu/Gln/Arg/opine family amino acid ABC transporter permease subunit
MHILPWDLTVIPSKFFLFTEAAQYTLQITFFGILLGLMIGLTAALGRLSHRSWLSALCRSYIFLVRGTPLLVQLFIVYYGLTSLVTIAPIPSAVLALGFHNGAYIAEIFRGSIQSIDIGQMEAARSLGMPRSKAMQRVILPQAFKRAVPPVGQPVDHRAQGQLIGFNHRSSRAHAQGKADGLLLIHVHGDVPHRRHLVPDHDQRALICDASDRTKTKGE